MQQNKKNSQEVMYDKVGGDNALLQNQEWFKWAINILVGMNVER